MPIQPGIRVFRSVLVELDIGSHLALVLRIDVFSEQAVSQGIDWPIPGF